MPRKEIHIVPHPDGWAVKKKKAKRASSLHKTKAEAMKEGIKKAKEEKAELIPHNKDGKISNPNSYGKDSNPPKDKKP